MIYTDNNRLIIKNGNSQVWIETIHLEEDMQWTMKK